LNVGWPVQRETLDLPSHRDASRIDLGQAEGPANSGTHVLSTRSLSERIQHTRGRPLGLRASNQQSGALTHQPRCLAFTALEDGGLGARRSIQAGPCLLWSAWGRRTDPRKWSIERPRSDEARLRLRLRTRRLLPFLDRSSLQATSHRWSGRKLGRRSWLGRTGTCPYSPVFEPLSAVVPSWSVRGDSAPREGVALAGCCPSSSNHISPPFPRRDRKAGRSHRSRRGRSRPCL
jgi:hypothetical protein